MGDTSTPSRTGSSNATGTKSAAERGSAVSRAGQRILASMLRRADVQSVDVESADASTLNIEEVDIGDASVERFSLRDIRTLIDTGRVTMNDVRSIMDFRIRVSWEVHIWGPNPRGSFTTRSFSIPFDVGDIDIPELENMDISVSSAEVEGTVATVQSIANLSFNGGRIDNIEIADIRLPTNGYGMAGLGIDTFNLSHIGVPDASIGTVRIGSLTPEGMLTLPSAEISNIGISSVNVPSVTTNQSVTVTDIVASPPPISLINLWILTVDIRLLPVLTMHIGGVTLDDMEATSTIASATLENMRFPLQVNGMELSDISVSGLRANEISL